MANLPSTLTKRTDPRRRLSRRGLLATTGPARAAPLAGCPNNDEPLDAEPTDAEPPDNEPPDNEPPDDNVPDDGEEAGEEATIEGVVAPEEMANDVRRYHSTTQIGDLEVDTG